MAEYLVVGLVNATVSETVEADSPEEAVERATLYASICHQCGRELEVGDVYAVRVISDGGAGKEVYTDDETEVEVERLEVERDALRARVKELEGALRDLRDACDRLMGDTDMNDDDSVEMRAMQRAARVLDAADEREGGERG